MKKTDANDAIDANCEQRTTNNEKRKPGATDANDANPTSPLAFGEGTGVRSENPNPNPKPTNNEQPTTNNENPMQPMQMMQSVKSAPSV
jgi:hypothetical protein